jgi:hypothetical protein
MESIKLGAKLAEVVDFAIEDKPAPAIRHGLHGSGIEIDDGQALKSEGALGLIRRYLMFMAEPEALAIRAAMDNFRGHAREDVPRHAIRLIPGNHTGNTAHCKHRKGIGAVDKAGKGKEMALAPEIP